MVQFCIFMNFLNSLLFLEEMTFSYPVGDNFRESRRHLNKKKLWAAKLTVFEIEQLSTSPPLGETEVSLRRCSR